MRVNITISLVRFVAWLPLPLLRGAGWLLGQLLYRIPNRERRNAEINLQLCFPDYSAAQRRALLHDLLIENSKTLMEMPKAWLGNSDRWVARIDPAGVVDEMRGLLAQGRGLIVAAPHLGNWEVGVHLMSRVAPVTILYRPPRQQAMEAVIVEGRGKQGGKLVPTDRSGIKALFQALRKGEMVAILPDQQPKLDEGGAGVFAPFFGVPALTMTLVNRLANKTGAPVYYLYTRRIPEAPGFRFHGHAANPAVADDDPVVAATALNEGVERCVRENLAQYQWTYRRFQSMPDGGKRSYQ